MLTDAVAPHEGHRQWFAEDARAALPGRGPTVRETTVDGRLDLGPVRTDPAGAGEHPLDFLVQGRASGLPPAARALPLAHLRDIALPGAGRVVPRPLRVAVVTR